MTFDDRVRALQWLRLGPRQTRFLVTVALHGGYFMRRQYRAFTGRSARTKVCGWPDGLVARRLAERVRLGPNRTDLYFLQARSIYRAVEQDEGRRRTVASTAFIARKLMVLDYVLSVGEAEWYATEQDKVELFRDRFRIASGDLPQRSFERWPGRARQGRTLELDATTHYFPDGFPIYVAGSPPVVHFVYLVTHTTRAPCEHFLVNHARLFGRLSAWAVVAISPPSIAGASACRAAFDRFASGGLRPHQQRAIDDLRWYFLTRRAFEADDYSGVSGNALPRWHDVRRRFAGGDLDALYRSWLAVGDAALPVADSGVASGVGRVILHELPFRYAEFGSFPGIQ